MKTQGKVPITATEAAMDRTVSPMVFVHYLMEDAGFTKAEIDRVYTAYFKHIKAIKKAAKTVKGMWKI